MRYIIKDGNKMAEVMHFISNLPIGKPWLVEIKEYKANRSNSQNALYWMWLEVISAYMGESKEDLHERFAVKFLGVDEKEVTFRDADGMTQKQTLIRPKTTTKLTTQEFTEYLEKIELTINTAFENFQLPHPDDYRYAMGGTNA